jgi:hypothetical protein
MPLNDDQKLQIEDALATAGYCLPQQEFARLVSRIETSIAAYECTVGGSSPREAMNALERLWKLTQKYDRESSHESTNQISMISAKRLRPSQKEHSNLLSDGRRQRFFFQAGRTSDKGRGRPTRPTLSLARAR